MDPTAACFLARGDFSALRARFQAAGRQADEPAAGVLRILGGPPKADRLLLSVGVHGDETAPIELLARILEDLAGRAEVLAVDLMVVLASPHAVAANQRFLDRDLNRLFRDDAPMDTPEGARAAALRNLSEAFFGKAPGRRVHLDLHSTIKPSIYPCFAVVPHAADSAEAEFLCRWLARGGLQAVLFSSLPTSTFSGYSARALGATSATVELGVRGALGGHDLSTLGEAARMLMEMLTGGLDPPAGLNTLRRFAVAREIIRRSTDFRLNLDPGAPNFTAFPRGEIIAVDGEFRHYARGAGECIVFPNAEVAIGARAAVMIMPME
jgi:succinylglutamate desuccinylase